jgi:bifunctional non-homologous end joining protein LigD
MKIKVGTRTIELSNTDKLLFPKDGITKGDVIEYYRTIAPIMLPLVRGRLIAMQRFPNGIASEGFFQKEAGEYFPAWIKRKAVKKKGGVVNYVVLSDAATLVYLANQGCLTPHIWLSKAAKLNYPDRMIFDLDPSGKDFSLVIAGAKELKKRLEADGLTPFVMTTGSRGLHVVVPLKPRVPFDEVRDYARAVAESMATDDPKHFTVELRKDKRKDRVFIDYLRNSFGATGVAPYAIRPLPGAPVATPLDWAELTSRLTAQKYTIANVLQRLRKRADPWHGLNKQASTLPQLLFILFSFLAPALHASEYILYKEGQGREADKPVMIPLDAKEHAQAYEVLMKYQFPMSLSRDVAKDLTRDELALLDTNEERFLQSKMPAGVKVLSIPKVVYELLLLSSPTWHEALKELYRVYFRLAGPTFAWFITDESRFDTSRAVQWLAHPMSVKTHFDVNNYALEYLNKNPFKLDEAHIASLIQDFKDDKIRQELLEQKSVITNIALQEQAAHRAGDMFLYRGTTPFAAKDGSLLIDSTLKDSALSHSISYGSSMFTGFFADKGTSPICYMLPLKCADFINTQAVGYALKINKADYRSNGNSSHLFFIPPLNTLSSVVLRGEYFHPRSKITSLECTVGLKSGKLCAERAKNFTYLLTAYTRDKDEHEKNFQSYLRANLILLKDGDQLKQKSAAVQLQKAATEHKDACAERQVSAAEAEKKEVKAAVAQQETPTSSVWSSLARNQVLSPREKNDLFMQDCERLLPLNDAVPPHDKDISELRIATYNVHMWYDPKMMQNYKGIMDVIREINADVLVLQEAIVSDRKVYEDLKKMGYVDFIKGPRIPQGFLSLGMRGSPLCERSNR